MGVAPRLIGATVLFVMVADVPSAGAQITAATIAGIITDETGGVLPGVEVTVKNLETGLTRSAVTGEDGSFNIPGLPPGLYEARATLSGFASAIQSGIQLAVAQQASLNLAMKVGASETLIVVGTPALVDTKTTTLSAHVDERTIQELPLNGRNFIDLALLQPGVAAFTARQPLGLSGRGTQIHINGAGGRTNSYLLDGANMSAYAGLAVATAADTTLGVDMIREFRVVTNAFSADYGRAMGGVITVVTKSGTNDFRGSGFEFFRHSAMDARNFFAVDERPFERHQFGFTAGGAIRKNRTFFFGGGEWLMESLGLTQVTEVPSVAALAGEVWPIDPVVRPYLDLFPHPNGPDLGDGLARFSFPFDQATSEMFVQGRVDHNFSSASAVFVRYTLDDARRRLPTSLPQFSSDQKSRNQWLTVEEKRVLSAALLNTARFSYSRVRHRGRSVEVGVGPDLAFVPGLPTIGNIAIGGIRELLGPDRTNPQHQYIEFFTFSDDVAYSKGHHFLKAGVLVERAHTDTEISTNVRGRFTFPNLPSFLAGIPSRFTGVLPGAELARSRRNTTFGFYLQDDLTLRSRLTFNLGLRYEFYTVPNDTNGRDSALRNVSTDREFTVGPIFKNPSLKNLGPRVGVAWDVSGDGKTSVRGGAGVYYDTDAPFNSALLPATFTPPGTIAVNLTNPTFPHPSFEGAIAERAARGIDYNVRQPRMLAGNVNLQREVLPNLVLMMAYAGSRGYNLVQAIEGNPAIPQTLSDGTKFFPLNAPRRNPNWGSIDFRTTGGRSWYNALQLGATKRFGRGHRWQASYTFGKTIDETQGYTGADAANSSVFPQDPIDPQNDRGRADFDVRHVFTMNFTWEVPFGGHFSGLAAAFARGWRINGLGVLRSGVPFSPSIQPGVNWSQSGNVATSAEDRPDLRSGVRPEDIILGGPTQYFDPTAFVLQPRGFLGNAGRNMLTGPGFVNFDLSVVKNNRLRLLGDDGELELRIEAFNVFNRTNFSLPNRVVFGGVRAGEEPLTTAGQITSTMNEARQVQLGVKLRF
jgi:hypothetical protein